MHDSPQMRRLRSDLEAMEQLVEDSSIVRFQAFGNPPTRYVIEFHGRSLVRDRNKVLHREQHQVEVRLGASYPRTMPELRWLSPVYHPNISEIGLVCLGAYGTHWVPSLFLDELCNMLWDMARYHNYDIRSPYNRDAALWVANQTTFGFPTDARPLRDLRIAKGRIEVTPMAKPASSDSNDGQVNGEGGVEPPAERREELERNEEILKNGEPLVIFDQEVKLPPKPPAPPPPEPDVIFLD